jgi:hypothetical protein
MAAQATKDQILEDAGYTYSFEKALYINRRIKKAFSIEFVEDHTDAELLARINESGSENGNENDNGENGNDRWQFYFNAPPSESVKHELERVLH